MFVELRSSLLCTGRRLVRVKGRQGAPLSLALRSTTRRPFSAEPQRREPDVPLPPEDKGDSAERVDARLSPLSDFDLSPTAVRLLQRRGIQGLFPIQAETFPTIVSGQDVVGRAKTGTGKTLGFALPVLERLRQAEASGGQGGYGRAPRVLVLAPTRELAKQVAEEFAKYGPEFSVLSLYGGSAYGPQEGSLRRGTDIVVGTPGRLLDHLERRNLSLKNIMTLIMDEADHMLDMGFASDMEKILHKIKEDKQELHEHSHQTLLFSATMPVWVRKVSRAFLKPDQVMIDLVGEDAQKVAATVTHFAIPCDTTASKPLLLRDVVRKWAPNGKAICFVERKVEADEIEHRLGGSLNCAALHGDVSQQRRDQIITLFKAGKLDLLLATDVAARGIDIPAVPLVIHNEPTRESESFIHRSGRTGRAGSTGTNVVLFTPQEEGKLQFLASKTGVSFGRAMVHPKDSLQAVFQKTMADVLAVPPERRRLFAADIEQVVGEDAPVSTFKDLLAGALAIMTGQSGVAQSFRYRSHINGMPNRRTHLLHFAPGDAVPQTSGQGYALIRKKLGADDNVAIENVRSFADRKGVVFDLPADVSDAISHDLCPPADLLPPLLASISYHDRDGFSRRGQDGPRRSYGGSYGSRNDRFRDRWANARGPSRPTHESTFRRSTPFPPRNPYGRQERFPSHRN